MEFVSVLMDYFLLPLRGGSPFLLRALRPYLGGGGHREPPARDRLMDPGGALAQRHSERPAYGGASLAGGLGGGGGMGCKIESPRVDIRFRFLWTFFFKGAMGIFRGIFWGGGEGEFFSFSLYYIHI